MFLYIKLGLFILVLLSAADMAFQIIQQYGDLVDSVDENGLTPLHLLASKPTAFRSGTPLSWFERIIYHCESLHDLFCDSLI